MKKRILILFLIIVALRLNTQVLENIFGAHVKSGQDVFTKLNVLNSTYSLVSTLPGTFSIYSETTFDDINNRYFINTTSGILVINALNGNLVDTITTVPSMRSMEYDAREDRLVGMRWDGNVEKFCQVDVFWHTYSDISILPGVTGVVEGESTFDPKTRRYFTRTNLGVMAIDSNGVKTNTYSSPFNFYGLEYEAINDRICGTYWTGSTQMFACVDLAFNNFASIGALDGVTSMVSETTMDRQQAHYFTHTTLGIFEMDAITGMLIKKIPVQNNFGGIEYRSLPDPQALSLNKTEYKETGCSIFPNPTQNEFTFSGSREGERLRIFDAYGKLVYDQLITAPSVTIDFSGKTAGIYLYSIMDEAGSRTEGRLVLR